MFSNPTVKAFLNESKKFSPNPGSEDQWFLLLRQLRNIVSICLSAIAQPLAPISCLGVSPSTKHSKKQQHSATLEHLQPFLLSACMSWGTSSACQGHKKESLAQNRHCARLSGWKRVSRIRSRERISTSMLRTLISGFIVFLMGSIAQGQAPNNVTSRHNIFGGFAYFNGVSSRKNIFGGHDYSNGGTSRRNIFGGQDYAFPKRR